MSGMLSAAEVHELGKATLHQNLAHAVSAVEDITSQRALARAAGLSHAHLAVVLAGNRRLTLTTAKNIAAALEAWSDTCKLSAFLLRAAIGREAKKEGAAQKSLHKRKRP